MSVISHFRCQQNVCIPISFLLIFSQRRTWSRYIELFRSVKRSPFVKSSFTTLKLARLFLTEQARKYLTIQYLTYIWKAEGQIKREKGKKGTMRNSTKSREKIRNARHAPFSRHFLLSSLQLAQVSIWLSLTLCLPFTPSCLSFKSSL